MAWRISETELKDLVETGNDPDGNAINLKPFIDMASRLTDKLHARDASALLSTDDLKQIEFLLAAHFYSLRDQLYTSKSTGGASGSFQVGSGNGLAETAYGRNAIAYDETGFLSKLSSGNLRTIQVEWLGKQEADKLEYDERS